MALIKNSNLAGFMLKLIAYPQGDIQNQNYPKKFYSLPTPISASKNQGKQN